jgi:hypothetical protein
MAQQRTRHLQDCRRRDRLARPLRRVFAQAIRTGDMPAGGESGLVLYEMHPQRYAKARGSYYAGTLRAPIAAAAAASAALAR